jgi:3-hydroxy-9,10-secoandrosta-1,3,5(10)-triene-9,17-dione monooxygenase
MHQTEAASSTIPVPEPELTPREIVARAEAMRPRLLELQEETEKRTFYSEETHRAFTEAGFYRILQPRRFGGYEFDMPTYFRVIMEIARGCPSTGWCLCLGGAHVLQVASMYSEQAQAEFFAPEGHFICASFGFPVGVAQPRDGGYVLEGTWPYASGIPYSTHFMGQTLLHPEDPTDPGLMFVIEAEKFTRLDDWGDVLGMVGSGSHSIRIDKAWIPEHYTVRHVMVDLPVEGGTAGSRLHGNPMYAGRTLGFFHGEFGAIVVGAAKAALDEYERLITTRPATWVPTMKRYELIDYQRYFGQAIAEIACAEAAVIQGAEQWMELARQNVEEGRPFTAEDDARLEALQATACRVAWHAVENILFRTAGSASARNGQRMQRYWRDLSTYWSHNTPAQRDLLLTRLGRRRLGLPLDQPGMLPIRSGPQPDGA